MSDELEPKPCPFCGRKASVRNLVGANWCVVCTCCQNSTQWCVDVEDESAGDAIVSGRTIAVERWNRRVSDDLLAACEKVAAAYARAAYYDMPGYVDDVEAAIAKAKGT